MKGISEPFFQIFRNANPVIPQWTLFITLIKLAFLKRIFPGKNNVHVSMGKVRIYGPDYDLLSFLIKEKFVREEYRFLSDTKNPIIIDCGSSIGISAIYFKLLYPEAIVHCFEPNPEAFNFLKLNISSNNLSGIIVNQLALTADGLPADLFIPEYRPLINSGLSVDQPAKKILTESIRLSSYIKNLPKVDLIKMDVEGAEKEIIEDLRNSGRLSEIGISNFIIECHHFVFNSEEKKIGFSSLFTDSGYSVETEVLFPENTQSDYLLRAAKPQRS